MGLMRKLIIFVSGVALLALSSCGPCNCNKVNPELLKDYKPTSTKSF